MQVKLRYFASLREALAIEHEIITLSPEIVSTIKLREYLASRGGVWAEQFATKRALRAAINQDMVRGDVALNPGDEVAFFPPVTGG